jgi:hypothetical protein
MEDPRDNLGAKKPAQWCAALNGVPNPERLGEQIDHLPDG